MFYQYSPQVKTVPKTIKKNFHLYKAILWVQPKKMHLWLSKCVKDKQFKDQRIHSILIPGQNTKDWTRLYNIPGNALLLLLGFPHEHGEVVATGHCNILIKIEIIWKIYLRVPYILSRAFITEYKQNKSNMLYACNIVVATTRVLKIVAEYRDENYKRPSLWDPPSNSSPTVLMTSLYRFSASSRSLDPENRVSSGTNLASLKKSD